MQRTIWRAAFAAFTLVVGGLWAYSAHRERDAALSLAWERLSSLALLLGQHSERAMEAGDSVVQAAAELAAITDYADLEQTAQLHEQLKRLIEGSPQISSAWILGPDGRTVAENWEHPPASQGVFLDRPYFTPHLEAGSGLHIGETSEGTVTRRQRFTLSRRIERRDGTFGGVAAVGVYSDYFQGIYEQVGLDGAFRIALAHSGTGRSLAQWSAEGVDAADEVISASATVLTYPVQLVVSQPLASVLAEWRARALGSALLAGFSVAAFAGLTLLGLRVSRGERRAVLALEEANSGLEKRVRERTALLAEREERLRVIIESLKDYAVITLDPKGKITSWNSGAERILGYTEAEATGRDGRLFFVPEDVARGDVERELQLAREAGAAANERWHVRKDGTRFWASGLALPLVGGPDRGFVKIFRDLTDRKQAEEHRNLLINELNHRVKNTLAIVQSIAAQSLKGSGTEKAAREGLESRLIALARAHDLLTRTNWTGTTLVDLARQELLAFAREEEDESRITIDGPDVWLQPKAAVSLGMAFHELATNAAKYGALSVPEGELHLTWQQLPGERGARLRIVWQERNGPPVQKPERKGFGTRLVEHGLAAELEGTVRLDYLPQGVVCTIEMPLPEQKELAHAG